MAARDSSFGTATRLRSGQPTSRGSIPGTGSQCRSSPKRPDRLRGLPSLVFSGYRGSLPETNRSRRELSTHYRLVRRRLRMSGVIPPVSLTPSWPAQEQQRKYRVQLVSAV